MYSKISFLIYAGYRLMMRMIMWWPLLSQESFRMLSSAMIVLRMIAYSLFSAAAARMFYKTQVPRSSQLISTNFWPAICFKK